MKIVLVRSRYTKQIILLGARIGLALNLLLGWALYALSLHGVFDLKQNTGFVNVMLASVILFTVAVILFGDSGHCHDGPSYQNVPTLRPINAQDVEVFEYGRGFFRFQIVFVNDM